MIGECDNCGFETKLKNYDSRNSEDGDNLCEVCAKTLFAHALFYPEQCSNAALFRSLAWSVNKIIETIRENKNA